MKNRTNNIRIRLRRLSLPALGCRRRVAGCLLLLLLLLSAACALLFWLAQPAHTFQADPPSLTSPLSVVLLIDNSDSMFARDGAGSDPDQLRLDAARFFISYLGVDDSRLTHQCSVVYFGSQTDVLFPLTPLTDASERERLLALLQNPPRLGWTDQAQALQQARRILDQAPPAARPVVILLTDGKPEWTPNATAAEQQTYARNLRAQAQALANAGIPLFIILLTHPTAAADPEIRDFWQPIWQQIAAAAPPGRFFQARQPEHLAAIYHDIIVTLNGSAAAPTAVMPSGQSSQIAVPPHLSRLSLVIHKSHPDLVIAISLPGDTPLSADQPGVRYAGIPAAHQEIWTIDDPPPGQWTIHARGPGQITVWPAYRQITAAYAPTPTAVAATARPLTAPGASSPTPTATTRPPAPTTVAAAAVSTPTPTVTMPPKARLPENGKNNRLLPPTPSPMRWILPGLALIALAVVSALGIWKYHQGQQPIVEGELYHLSGPGFASGQLSYELDALSRRAITVGASPADIVLVSAPSRFTLHPGPQGRPVLIPGPETWLDNQPLLHERPLHDNALITLGPTRLRYQNLRLRLNAAPAPPLIPHTSYLPPHPSPLIPSPETKS